MHPFLQAAILGAATPHEIVIQGSLIAGVAGGPPNENIGWSIDVVDYGTINPDPLFVSGFLAQKITTADFLNVFSFTLLPTVIPGTVPNTDAIWKTLSLTGVFRAGGSRTITRLRSEMGYTVEIDETRWAKIMGTPPDFLDSDDDMMVGGNTYTLVITSG